VAHLKDGPATLIPEEIARIESRFTRPNYLPLPATDAGLEAALAADRAFANWHKRNVHPHKKAGYAAVTLVPEEDRRAARRRHRRADGKNRDLADRYSFGELRVSHEQNLIFADVQLADLHSLWQEVVRWDSPRPTSACSPTSSAARAGISLARQRQIDPGRGHPATLRRSRLPARHRRNRSQHFRMHERLRPPPRRPYRHSRRRQERRGVVSDRSRRQPG